jgi:hypothetical protein
VSYRLFLDDVREVPNGFLVARDYVTAVHMMIGLDCPKVMSFDHDLGEEKSGYDVAWWMVEKDMDEDGKWIPRDFEYYVHSANPVGAENISKLFKNYLKMRG